MTTTAYVEVTDADDYFAARLNATAWSVHTDDRKTAALLQATDIIDGLNYAGLKTAAYIAKAAGCDKTAIRAAAATQLRQFPRNGESDVPVDINAACCEIALALLSGVDPDEEMRLLATTGESIGPLGLKVTFDRSKHSEWTLAGVPSPSAWRLLVPYLRDLSAISIRRG